MTDQTASPPQDALSQTLGLQRIILMDAETGRAKLEYLAGLHMCHSGGVVQGEAEDGHLRARVRVRDRVRVRVRVRVMVKVELRSESRSGAEC